MKTAFTTVLLGLLTLHFFSCKKSEVDSPAPSDANCKLTAIDRENGNRHRFEYNPAGYVSKWTLLIKNSGSDHEIVYSLKYDGANQVTGATITVDGKTATDSTILGLGNRVECRWTNGKLTEVKDMLGEKPVLKTTISYDAQGHQTRFQCVPGNKNELPFEKTYTYDASENFVYNYLEDGIPLDQTNATVDKSHLSAESLLPKHGLVFDFYNIIPYRNFNLKTFSDFLFDQNGKPVLDATYTITKVTKNRHNFVTSQTVEQDGKGRLQTFALADCD